MSRARGLQHWIWRSPRRPQSSHKRLYKDCKFKYEGGKKTLEVKLQD